MRRVLVVAYYFPPVGGIGSLRALGHARYLPEHGWDTTVLAPRSPASQRDEGLHFPEERVVRSGSVELSRLGKSALRTGGGDMRAAPVVGVRGAARRAAHAGLYFPDAQVGWAPFALRAGTRALRERPVDAIVSTSFPITAHVVARRLASAAGIPWVAEFRDPWSELQPAGLRRRRAARLERSLAGDAAAIVMTSPTWAERHARLWDRPVDVIPNGHDLAGALAPAPSPGFVLGYLGTYYPGKQASLTPLWTAINELEAQDALQVDEIRVIGTLDPAMLAQLSARGLEDRVHVTGQLSHAAAVAQLAACSAALLAGPADARGIFEGHVPGKVWEYLATDLPVIYVGAEGSDAARLLAGQPGTHLVHGDDIAAATAALRAAAGRRHARDASAYSRRARAGALAGVLDRVAGSERSAA